jgi:hypothetical protein
LLAGFLNPAHDSAFFVERRRSFLDETRPVEKILSHLSAVKKSGEGWGSRCPAHEDKERSLSIGEGAEGNALINCFAGCQTTAVLDAIGLRLRDLYPRRSAKEKLKKDLSLAELAADKGLPEEFLKEIGVSPIIDLFDRSSIRITYRLEDGSFAPRQRNRTALKAKQGSFWSKTRGDIVPYGLEKLPEARNAGYINLVEGESDCWTLWYHGFPALGIPGADLAKKIQAAHLKGIERVYVFREPDQGGSTFVQGVACRLKDIGWNGQAFELKLDGVKDPNELHKHDPAAFKDVFQKAMDSAALLPEPPAQHTSSEELPDRKLPEIDAGEGDLKTLTTQAWAVLRAANVPEKWFRCGGIAMRIEQDDEQRPVLRELIPDRLRHILARVARWKRKNKWDEVVPVPPPMTVVKDMLATPNLPLPILIRIVESPVFAANGELQTKPGYHEASRTYYAPADGFSVPPVPDVISPSVLAEAVALIDDVLCDFPFAGNAERAHALAGLLLPFARDMISGPTPLHLIEAPSPGTGKGLLSMILVYVALGRPVSTMTEGHDEDEWRKRLTAKLLSVPLLIMLDNLRRRLDSAALSAAITTPSWEDRILGQTKVVSLLVRCVWMATGNNPALSSEMSRRTIRIRLDAKVDRPWLRNGFHHPNLSEWVRENRAKLVWACLTIVRAWINAGHPLFKERTLGMFESWSEVMGGILQTAGIKGFLANLEEFYENSDAEGTMWRGFVRAWWDKFNGDEVGVSELFDLNNGLEEALDLGKGNEKSQKTRLGQELVKMRDRQFEECRIVLVGERQRAKRWKLVQVTPSPESEPVNLSEPFSPQPKSDLSTEANNRRGENSSPRFTGSLPLDLPELSNNGAGDYEKVLREYYSEKSLEVIKKAQEHFPGCRVVLPPPKPSEGQPQ